MKSALISTSNLLFRSKLSLMLQGLELNVVVLHTNDNLRELVLAHKPLIVVFDLSRENLDSVDYVRQLRSAEIGFGGPILCFGPHVATDLLAAAQSAGANMVIPNSVFSARGGKVIESLLKDGDEEQSSSHA